MTVPLLDRIRAQNTELDQFADELIEREAPGYKRLAIIRDRDRLREALKEILDYAEMAIQDDRNPNKGDLMKISRIAATALKETE